MLTKISLSTTRCPPHLWPRSLHQQEWGLERGASSWSRGCGHVGLLHLGSSSGPARGGWQKGVSCIPGVCRHCVPGERDTRMFGNCHISCTIWINSCHGKTSTDLGVWLGIRTLGFSRQKFKGQNRLVCFLLCKVKKSAVVAWSLQLMWTV